MDVEVEVLVDVEVDVLVAVEVARIPGIEKGSRPANTTTGEAVCVGLAVTDGDGAGEIGGTTGPTAAGSPPPANRLNSRNSTRMPPSTGPPIFRIRLSRSERFIPSPRSVRGPSRDRR